MADATARWGITVPFNDVPLPDHRRWFEEIAELGYTDLWSAEADAADGFTPLALASTWAPSMQLGVGIVPAFTRGPALLAQSAAAMAEAAPGRFTLGLGSSSDVIVERWNGIAFDRPYARVRDTLRFLRKALAGEKVTEEYETFRVRGFRLGRPPEIPPPVFVAALRPGMLRLAGREADGVVLNWLSAEDVAKAVGEAGAGTPAVTRIFVIPDEDAEAARATGRRMITAYLNVPAYAEYQRWLGRTEALQPMWDAWASGDRKGALAAVPNEVVDDLIVHGSAEECRAHIQRYVDNGTTVPVLWIVTPPDRLAHALRGLAPGV
jgi:probable F420-dependent oxidoreductase